MTWFTRVTQSLTRGAVLGGAVYEGSRGIAFFVGAEPRAPSIASFFCGHDLELTSRGHVLRRRIPERITEVAEGGGLPILRLRDGDRPMTGLIRHSITVPSLVGVHVDLPTDTDTLRSGLLTSTTREDFRRIRRAGFTYRVTSDPDAVREFYARHFLPTAAQRLAGDGGVKSLDKMLGEVERGAELVCADIDGTWVAGILNLIEEGEYRLMSLGIRDASKEVRQKRVVAALIVRSLERAVELGKERATLGRSVPFLGKGPVWFKAKWSGVLSTGPTTRYVHIFADLRHAAVRRMLAESPIVHAIGDTLAASAWLEPGENPLHVIARDSQRFAGVSRWYVLGEAETLDAAVEAFAGNDRIIPVPVSPSRSGPVWLADLLSGSDTATGDRDRSSTPSSV